MVASFYDYYETADGRYLSVGSLEPQFIHGLAQILELPILARKRHIIGPARPSGAVKQAIKDKIKSARFCHVAAYFSATRCLCRARFNFR